MANIFNENFANKMMIQVKRAANQIKVFFGKIQGFWKFFKYQIFDCIWHNYHHRMVIDKLTSALKIFLAIICMR
jgi:hypothetical protein